MSQHDDTTRIETLLDESDQTTTQGRGEAEQPSGQTDAGRPDRTEELRTAAPEVGPDTGSDERTDQRADEGTADRARSAAAPPTASTTPGTPGTVGTADSAYQQYRGEPAPGYKSGPAPTTSVVGLLGLLTVIAVLIAQATDLDIPWGVVGPVAVVGAGVLLVVLGVAGLRGQRYRG